LPLCTSFKEDGNSNSLLDFDNAMRDSKNTKECEKMCLPNCDETTYAYTIDTTELNIKELCRNKDTKKVSSKMQFFYVPELITNILRLPWNCGKVLGIFCHGSSGSS
jgi:hypothetical protein